MLHSSAVLPFSICHSSTSQIPLMLPLYLAHTSGSSYFDPLAALFVLPVEAAICSIRSVYLSSLPCNPEAGVSQLILSYSKFSSYLSNLSIYFLLVLSKIKPAAEEPLYILILSGVLDVQSSSVHC